MTTTSIRWLFNPKPTQASDTLPPGQLQHRWMAAPRPARTSGDRPASAAEGRPGEGPGPARPQGRTVSPPLPGEASESLALGAQRLLSPRGDEPPANGLGPRGHSACAVWPPAGSWGRPRPCLWPPPPGTRLTCCNKLLLAWMVRLETCEWSGVGGKSCMNFTLVGTHGREKAHVSANGDSWGLRKLHFRGFPSS